MVHQHFMLVDELTVAENLVLGMEPLRHGLFDMEEAVRITGEIAEKYNFEVGSTRHRCRMLRRRKAENRDHEGAAARCRDPDIR